MESVHTGFVEMPGVEERKTNQNDSVSEDLISFSTPVEVAKEQPPRLCGYLTKLSGKGPLRSFKNRWFVLDPRRCYLYYFKSQQDAQPMGHIDVGNASFSYDMEAEEGQFEIHSSGRVSILRASSRRTMTYWLQELQQKRWEYCNSLTSKKRDSIVNPTSVAMATGLVAKEGTAGKSSF